MTDAIFFEAEEELHEILKRMPSYEEVLDMLNGRYKENNYERREYQKSLSGADCRCSDFKSI